MKQSCEDSRLSNESIEKVFTEGGHGNGAKANDSNDCCERNRGVDSVTAANECLLCVQLSAQSSGPQARWMAIAASK